MNNSVNEIIEVLEQEQFLSENEIMWRAFGFLRSFHISSNKKYAEMLRRAMDRGVIKRVNYRRKGERSRYFYYTA